MKRVDFIEACFQELKTCGWLGEAASGPLSLFNGDETAILTFFGGDLYGLVVQDISGNELFVDQFVTLNMARDFARSFSGN